MIETPVHDWQATLEATGGRELTSADCADPNPFYDGAFLDAALAHLAQGVSIELIEATDEAGRVITRLPVERRWMHGRIPVPHVAAWTHVHCYYGAPMLRAGHEREGWERLLARLDADSSAGDFLHLPRIDPDGAAAVALKALCAEQGRSLVEADRFERALLRSTLSPQDYWTQAVRAKKRKELRRQQNRLAEEGTVRSRVLIDPAELPGWCAAFVALEATGWKGEGGTALGSDPAHEAFFHAACSASFAAGQLDMLRIDCDDRPIAMLVNMIAPTGGYSFKIAIDPAFGRFSPGVLIEIDNITRVLGDHVVPWMDSCAAPGHPMIDGLWTERRAIVQYRIALHRKGFRALRGAATRFAIARAETIARRLKGRQA